MPVVVAISMVVTIMIVFSMFSMLAVMPGMVMVAILYAAIVAVMVLGKQHTAGETAEKN